MATVHTTHHGVRPVAAAAKGLGGGRRTLALLTLALSTWCAPAGAAEAAAIERGEREAVEGAAARIAAGEPLVAINMVEGVIGAIELRANRYHPALAEPLLVLGDALADVGDTEGAFGAYGRALHVARVNHGLHHPGQVDAVYRQARLLARQGDHAAANGRHEYAYGVLLRSYGGDHPALLPGLFALADWYMQRFNIFSARDLYEHAATVAGAHLDAGHPARVRALRSVAATYRNERFPPFYVRRNERGTLGSYPGFQYRASGSQSVNSFARGERALIEVVNIVQERGDAPPAVLAQAMLELADWFQMFEKYRRATSLYHRVWELMAGDPQLRARTFAAPTPLYLPLPKPPGKPAGSVAAAREGVVELAIDVDERGFASGLTTLRSEPEDLMDFRVRRAVRRARYRPAFDGETSRPSTDVRVTHTFVYYPATGDRVDALAAGERRSVAARLEGRQGAAGGATGPSGTDSDG